MPTDLLFHLKLDLQKFVLSNIYLKASNIFQALQAFTFPFYLEETLFEGCTPYYQSKKGFPIDK